MRFLAAALAVLSLAACAGPDMQAPPLEITRVHDVPGKTKADVCRAARDWAAVTFRDSKAVVEVYDLETGTMIGKGRIIVAGFAGTAFPVDFTLQVDCKDGRSRSMYTGFMTTISGSSYPLREDSTNNLRSKTEARMTELDASLVKRLNAKAGDAW